MLISVWSLVSWSVLACACWFACYLLAQFVPQKINGPLRLPYLGNLVQLLRAGAAQYFLMNAVNKHGPMVRVSFPGLDATAISKARQFKEVLKSTRRNVGLCADANNHLIEKFPMKTPPLFNLYGAEWHSRRKFMAKVFAQQHIRTLIPSITDVTVKFVNNLADYSASHEPLDAQSQFSSLMLDVVGRIAFGYDFGCLSRSKQDMADSRFPPVVEATMYVFQKQIDEFYNPISLDLIRKDKKLAQAGELIQETISNMLTKYKALTPEELLRKGDLLALIMSVKHDESGNHGESVEPSPRDDSERKDESESESARPTAVETTRAKVELSEQQIKDETLQFIAAGFDTTSNTLAWFFYILCKHAQPSVQDKLADEIFSAFPQLKNGVHQDLSFLTYDSLSTRSLPFLTACFMEAQRLQPVIQFIERRLERDTVVDGIAFQEGSKFLCSLHSAHRDAAVWGDDVDLFRPERFLDLIHPDTDSKQNPEQRRMRDLRRASFLPFGGGGKQCIAMQLVQVQSRLILSLLLSQFRFQLKPNHPEVKPKDGLAVAPHPYVHLILTARS